jgi:hypothetical protein
MINAMLVLMGIISAQNSLPIQNKSNCQVYGAFTNSRPPAKNAEEYETNEIDLELWKCNNEIKGLILQYVGQPADPPTGLLKDVVFDSISGNFSFTAKLSIGQQSSKGDTSLHWSKDLYSFHGKLNKKSVVGTITKTNYVDSRTFIDSVIVHLKFSKQMQKDYMYQSNLTEVELNKDMKDQLDFRGPKW